MGVEEGESFCEGAARELLEEAGIRVEPEQLRLCGELTYEYESRPKTMQVRIYDIFDGWQGEPVESEEMRPVWVPEQEIPLEKMWADDEYWLPQYLSGALRVPFNGQFLFKGHEGTDSSVIRRFHVR